MYHEDSRTQFASAIDEVARRLSVGVECFRVMLSDGCLRYVEWAWRGYVSTIRMVNYHGRSVVVFDDGLILEEGTDGIRRNDWFLGFHVADPRNGDCKKGNYWGWSWI